MKRVLRCIPWLCSLPMLAIVLPVNATDYEKEAEQLFGKRFNARKIDGTGHVFGIVADCDGKRLMELADKLQKEQTKVVEYDFVMELNTQDKSKSRITNSGLDKRTETCIIDKYHKETMFMSGAPIVLKNKVRFPVLLGKNRQPFVPRTPIGFVTQEK